MVRIGGSDAAAACGVDPHRSRVMAWAEMTGRAERERTEAMEWGTALQPVVFAELERRGFELVPAPADDLRDPERPWLGGHVDGFVNLEGERGVLEIKTGSWWTGKEWAEKVGAPAGYIVQCHHYLHLTGRPVALLACLVGGQRLETRIVERDDLLLARILELEADFLNHVVSDTPPAPDGSTSTEDAIKTLHPNGDETRVRLTGQSWADLLELRQRREQRAELKRQTAELEQRIKLAMGDATEAVSPYDEVVVRWRNVSRTSLDTKALRETLPTIYGEYATTSTSRRFEVL